MEHLEQVQLEKACQVILNETEEPRNNKGNKKSANQRQKGTQTKAVAKVTGVKSSPKVASTGKSIKDIKGLEVEQLSRRKSKSKGSSSGI